MKNTSILLSLAVGLLGAAPAFADKLPHAATEQSMNSFSFHQHPDGNSMQDAVNIQNFGRSAFEDGKALATKDLLSMQPGKNDGEGHFIDLGLKDVDAFGKRGAKDSGKHKPKDVGVGGPTTAVVAVPEPGSFTLVLFGLGVLGVLRLRRN